VDRRIQSSAALAHPVFWAALLLLLINDHLLKGGGLLPGVLTGKLSDFAGLLVAPTVLIALLRLGSRAGALAAYGATGLVFALINIFPGCSALVERVLPWRVWTDPTDLVALPVLFVGWRWFVAAEAPPRSRALAKLGGAVGLLACLATSPAEVFWARVEPGFGETAVPVTVQPTVRLDRRAGMPSLSETTVTLADNPGGVNVPGTIEVVEDRVSSEHLLRFVPDTPLATDTDYRFTVAGKAIEEHMIDIPVEGQVALGPERPLVVDFSTRSDPRVLGAVVQRSHDENGPLGYVYYIWFSQAMNATTLTRSSVQLTIGGQPADIIAFRYDAHDLSGYENHHRLFISARTVREEINHQIVLSPGILAHDGRPMAVLPQTIVPTALR
jgi:hypothetical protein